MWAELTHLLSDPAHWMFEAVTDVALGLLPAKAGFRRWHERHDREEHSS
jgi:hypothetical protein